MKSYRFEAIIEIGREHCVKLSLMPLYTLLYFGCFGRGTASGMLELQTLGDLKIQIDGSTSALRSRKGQALLVYLAIEREPQPRSSLAALLWPESDQQHADTSLRVALAALNKVCGAYLNTSRERISIDWGQRVRVDLSDLLQFAREGKHARVLQLYGGSFLSGFHVPNAEPFETWRTWQEERVLRIVVKSFHDAIEQALRSGSEADPISLALQLLKLDPLDEIGHRAIMASHAQRGNRAAAMEQFNQCRMTLHRDLGTEPSDLTRLLYERIRNGDGVKAEASIASLPKSIPKKLPLIGRKQELVELLDKIARQECRLVTLVGPGGIGKSRLAIEALRKVADQFPDGVFFCPLSAAPSGDFIIPLVAQTLDFEPDTLFTLSDSKSQLLDYLSTKRILLLLDGFEHLVECADLLEDLLTHASNLMILVTSRERLRLRDEWVLPLEGLPFKSPDIPSAPVGTALELFEQRMLQVRGNWGLDNKECIAAEKICAFVEGNPLAIELAASWGGVLTASEILGQIQVSLDFLASRLRDLPDQHRSLRAVFDRSWSLLPLHLQQTFAALSVFRGSFDQEAAETVAGAGWQDLAALVERSLVRRNPLGRYELHALLNEYAGEKLGQNQESAEQVCTAYARYFLGFIHRASPLFTSTQMLIGREAVSKELTNIWHAMAWAIRYFDDDQVHAALEDLFSFYVVHGWHDGAGVFARLAEMISEAHSMLEEDRPCSHPLYRATTARQAWFLIHLGQVDECYSLSTACLKWAQDDDAIEDRSLCLNNLGVCACLKGQFEQGVRLLKQAISIGQGHAEPVFASYHLWLGYTRFLQGLYEESMVEYQQSYELFDQQGNQPGIAFVLSKMGLSADGMGSYEQGLEYHRRALEIFRATSHLSGQAYTYSRMSVDAYGMGNYSQAGEWAQKGLQCFRTLGHRWGISISLCRLAFAQIGLGHLEQASENLLNALSQAHAHHIAPLMLYSILGLACILHINGDKQKAAEMSRAVAKNPQTPPIYLELAKRWLPDLDLPMQQIMHDASPAFEATQTDPPSADVYALAGQLLHKARQQL